MSAINIQARPTPRLFEKRLNAGPSLHLTEMVSEVGFTGQLSSLNEMGLEVGLTGQFISLTEMSLEVGFVERNPNFSYVPVISF